MLVSGIVARWLSHLWRGILAVLTRRVQAVGCFVRTHWIVSAICALCVLLSAGLTWVTCVTAPMQTWPFIVAAEAGAEKNSTATIAPDDLSDYSPSDYPDSIASLLEQEAFYKAVISLAKSDSIALLINLVDSTAALSVRGTVIKEMKIWRYRISGGFKAIRASGNLPEWIATPAVVRDDRATIAKIPIKIKKAPKDTIEASKTSDVPGPLPRQDVYCRLFCDRNLRIVVNQTNFPTSKGVFLRFKNDCAQRLREGLRNLKTIASLKTPEAQVTVKIALPQDDAATIYRAIPRHASIVLYPPR
jgi:hypothetical protein